MWHVGMDWHSRQADLTVRDENGRRQFHRHVRGGIDAVITELKKIGKPFSITFEASTGYGHVYDELARIAHTVRVAHPGHLRLIFRSKRKCDRPDGPLLRRSGPAGVDSDKICKLDYLGRGPPGPRAEARGPRLAQDDFAQEPHGRGPHRHEMPDQSFPAVARDRRAEESLDEGRPDRLGVRRWSGVEAPGIEWLRGVELADEFDALMRDELVERLAHQNVLIRRVTRALDAKARAHPGVQLLMTIPGQVRYEPPCGT